MINPTDAKPYDCKNCDVNPTTSNELMCHRKQVHTQREDKPTSCPNCDENYNNCTNLKSHLKIHSGDQPFKCLHCLNSSASTHEKRTHFCSLHTCEDPECEGCQKGRAENEDLNVHPRLYDVTNVKNTLLRYILKSCMVSMEQQTSVKLHHRDE